MRGMFRPRRRFLVGVMFVLLLSSGSTVRGQVFDVLGSFAGCVPDTGCADDAGAFPQSTLLLAPDGNLYGSAGAWSDWTDIGPGVIYRVAPDGTRAVIHNFAASGGLDGCGPTGKLTVGADGALYGVTSGCGAHGGGTLFRLAGGSFTVLHHFQPPAAFAPSGGLALGADGALYGVTTNGTPLGPPYNSLFRGAAFKWDGTFTVVSYFPAIFGIGMFPAGDLTLASDGRIYGATLAGLGGDPWGEPGCTNDCGTLFTIDPGAGTAGMFHQFSNSEGSGPRGGLLQASDGNLYGVTRGDGLLDPSSLYGITQGGAFAALRPVDRWGYNGNLAEGFGGYIYGTTESGGTNFQGTIFRLAPDGRLETLHEFDGVGGRNPRAGLTIGPDGDLYGTTTYGGDHDRGVLFRLELPPQADITANGSQKPISVGATQPLQISIAFGAGHSDVIEPAEIYVAVITPWGGVYWMDQDSAFGVAPVVLYTGSLTSFGRVPVLTLPNLSAMPAGAYHWVMVVDADANGVPEGTYVDAVITTRR